MTDQRCVLWASLCFVAKSIGPRVICCFGFRGHGADRIEFRSDWASHIGFCEIEAGHKIDAFKLLPFECGALVGPLEGWLLARLD